MVANTRRVALCVATLEKLCRHPRLSVEEQKQLDIVVDTVKSGLYSNRFFGPPPKETVLNKSNSTEPIDMEPQFYFDLCKHLESTNDHLVSTSENLKANLKKSVNKWKFISSCSRRVRKRLPGSWGA